MMKKATLCSVMVVAVFSLYLAPAYAQRNLALYGMPGLQQASMANPSFIPDAGLVIGLPVLSNITASYSNSGLTLKDMGANGLRLRGSRLAYDQFLPMVEEKNLAYGELNTNLFSIGFRIKNQYFAFESSEHVVGTFHYPKTAIQFGADINAGNHEPGMSYNLNGLSYDLTHFRNFSVTYARDFGRASAGVRLRYLVGLENYSSAGPGVTLTATDATGVYDVLGRLELWAAGVQSLSGQGSYPLGGQGNHGFAFDFGSTYALGDKLTASFSVVNVGGIEWGSGARRKVIQNELKSPGTEIDDVFNSFIYGAPNPNLSYNSTLPTFVYLGGTYRMNNKNTFNLLFNSRYMQGQHSLATALSYSMKINPKLQATLAYSASNGSLLNLGGGFAAQLGPLQFFGFADNLLSAFTPLTSHNTHFTVGVNLVFNPKPKVVVATVDTVTASPTEAQEMLAREMDPDEQQPAPPPQNQPERTAQNTPPPPQNQPERTAQNTPPPPQNQPERTAQRTTPPPQNQPERTAQRTTPPPQNQPERTAQNTTPPPQNQPERTAQNTTPPPQNQPERTAQRTTPPPQNQPERTAQNTTPPPAEGTITPSASPRYTVFQGSIHLESRPEKVDHYYFDVYKVNPDGRRELIRTGREPSGNYKLYLSRGYDHEVNFRNSESAPLVIRIDKEDLESAGPNITRNITLRRADNSGEEEENYQPEPEREEGAPEAEDLMGLSVPELKQEEAEAIQRPVPKEEPSGLWIDQPARSLQLKQDISVYKDMDRNSRVIARLSTGMEIEVLERTTAEWWMVAYRSKIGWVETSMLK
ncbi:MAG: hypothetical protein J5I94_07910 [Phaeodactylibacter sp.]|nr:hypothetical protein [Phaeodactylibacter sp.]